MPASCRSVEASAPLRIAYVFKRAISEPLLPQQFDFALQLHVPDGACDGGESLVDVERLGNEVVGSQLHRLHRIRPGAVGGKDDDWYGGQQPFGLKALSETAPRLHPASSNRKG